MKLVKDLLFYAALFGAILLPSIMAPIEHDAEKQYQEEMRSYQK